jgi:hypothetical protein
LQCLTVEMKLMKTILYAWEFGGDLGHISVVLPLAKKWRALGVETIFAIPKFSRNIITVEKMLTANGFSFIAAPGSGDFTSTNKKIHHHLHLLDGLSAFQNSGVIAFYIKTWLDIFHLVKPDIVICDYALCAQMSARIAGVYSVSLDLGFFIPDSTNSMPDFLNTENRHSLSDPDFNRCWEDIRDKINTALSDITDFKVNKIADLYTSDYELVLNYKELAAFNGRDSSYYQGSIIDTDSDNPIIDWPSYDVRKPRIFAYLRMGNKHTRSILDALCHSSNKSVIAYIPHCPQKIIDHYQKDNVVIVDTPINVDQVLQKANLVICHAGVGMITQTLLAGIPLFLYPLNKEQELNTRRVLSLGVGDALNFIDIGEIGKQINNILFESYFCRNARAFSMKNKPADLAHIIDAIDESFKKVKHKKPYLCKYSSEASKEKIKFSDYDVVFLSYDEANADHNWNELKRVVPDAIRVHGVKGFDAAHKAAAAAARTERFILVDADNIVDEEFFKIEVEVPFHMHHSVWQWCSKNNVTGLRYPFGGVKIWTRELINNMKSHEACEAGDERMKTDFWEQPSYNTFYRTFSTNITNASPYHSFRAGYRESVKLGSCAGRIKDKSEFKPGCMYNPDIRRAVIWMSCGAEVDNGLWSILGARQGFIDYLSSQNDIESINNYDWFVDYWKKIYSENVNTSVIASTDWGRKLGNIHSSRILDSILEQGRIIKDMTPNIKILDMIPEQSIGFKHALDDSYDVSVDLFHSFHAMDGR